MIVDAYPKIEQMQCSCSYGCCGESDECLNRWDLVVSASVFLCFICDCKFHHFIKKSFFCPLFHYSRVILMECDSSCPRNPFCTNKRLFRRECVERLRTFQTTNSCGVGVKTDVNIDKGQVIKRFYLFTVINFIQHFLVGTLYRSASTVS